MAKQKKRTTKNRPKKRRKVNRRTKSKYPGLDTNLNPRIRWEYMDQDYISKLSPKEKDWLNRFNEEFNGAKFDHDGTVLHKSAKKKRECYNKNNARNRCVYSLAKARGTLDNMEVTKMEAIKSDENEVNNDVEDILIDYIDSKKK